MLLATDNQNTFPWLGDRTAKRGLELRIGATFHAWRIKNGIEVYPYYRRSFHNIRPDFITRESLHEVDALGEDKGFQQVDKPW